jgi:hypothetical protein
MNIRGNLLNKTLIFGVLFLFIGATVIPSISGYNKKISIHSVLEGSTSSPVNGDFINSFWRFNECSGSTLGDSSSPSYDGTIYGATWTTSGYSGCALVFDGINDYVDLSSHAAEILFNKTDDIILSFYFKSTGEGLIFSATASWGNNPEFRIELCSNGSILFYKITQMCGIILYSSGSYADGDWHHAEYHYNGITSNPTVTLYVDDVFDCTATHWLCEIEHDDYAKTKFGMHAHYSSDYFDGVIDEFKIIKYENGNEQEPPIIDGPTKGAIGEELTYTFTNQDFEEDDIWIMIDWGDGDITEWIGPIAFDDSISDSHSWTEEGIYCIRTKSMDYWDEGTWSDCFYVTIGNQPPNEPKIDGPTNGNYGTEYDYTFNATDPDEDSVMYFVDWGDNNTEWTEYSNSGEEITLKHTWIEEGTYIIKAKAKDVYEAESNWSEFEIEIPRNKANTNLLYYWLLEHFPILERLLGLFKLAFD